MLLWLLQQLGTFADRFGALEKITFRASMAAMASFLLAVVLGPRMIAWLRTRFREPIRSDSSEVERLHRDKQFTPTMGGLFIVAGCIAGVLLFGDLSNCYVMVALLVTAGLATLGAIDDLVKLRGATNGISARMKLAGQIVVATIAAVLIYQHHAGLADGLALRLPLMDGGFSLGVWFIPLAVLVIVGSSNAVNLTDGLDGLAGGCLIFATGAMTVVAYAAGHAELAHYLGIPRIPGSGEMTILAAAMIGGVLGFLWFNCHPAQVFMGDTGSLPLGGLLGLMAVVTRQELLLLIVAGVFVVEAASVILQVGSNRLLGRRILRCAPLHHHFQFLGWAENKIVVRFWIASALCAVLGMATLKLHVHDDAAGRTFDDLEVASRQLHFVRRVPVEPDQTIVLDALPVSLQVDSQMLDGFAEMPAVERPAAVSFPRLQPPPVRMETVAWKIDSEAVVVESRPEHVLENEKE